MSLYAWPIFEVPEETARIAHAAFPKSNIYIRIRNQFGVFFQDGDQDKVGATREEKSGIRA